MIAQGDEDAFTTIFHRYTPKLKAFIYGFVKVSAITDEILQELFLKVWLNKENLPSVNEPSAWIYRLATNLTLNQLKKQAIEYKHLKSLVGEEGREDILQKLSVKELQQIIYEAVAKLPEKRREIYLLSREEGLSHKEIADRLHLSIPTVKNQVTSALRSIQDYIFETRGVYIPLILLSAKIFLIKA